MVSWIKGGHLSAEHKKDNLNPNNFVPICHNCHIGTNTNREYWIKYFQGGKKNE